MNPAYIFPVIFACTAGLVFLGFMLSRALFGRVWPRQNQEGPSLVERAAAVRPPKEWEGKLDRSFDRMVRWTLLGITPGQALGFIILAGISLGCLFYLVTDEWWIAGIGLFLGMVLVLGVLLIFRGRWLRAVQDQLPEGLFLLSRSLRAGLTLEQAFAASRDYCSRPLVEVFGRVADQVEMGVSAADSVQRLADATALPDLHALASALALHREVGGNLPALLDQLATSVRDRNQFRGFYRAATALSRLSAVFVAGAAPVLGLILGLDQPDLFRNFFRDTTGLFLFGLAIVLEVVGLIWLTLLVRRVEY